MIRTHRLAPLALTMAMALVLLVPAPAFAATVREYQLQYAPAGTGSGSLMIVSALLNPEDSLPAVVTVPVPAGSTLLWAGEILGGEPAADPARDVTMERVGDMDVYTLTLEQAYTAQLEIQLATAAAAGDKAESSVTWTNPGEEVLVTASVIAEVGATDVKTKPERTGEIQTNDLGETLYPLTGERIAKGEAYVITVNWKRAGAAAEGSSLTLPIILGALVVAVMALVVVMTRERTRARRAADGTDL